MPRKISAAAGSFFEKRGTFYMRITVAPQERRAAALPWLAVDEAHHAAPCDCRACLAAAERAGDVQELVMRLRRGGHTAFVDKLVESAATADAEKLAALGRAVDGLVAGKLGRPATGGLTFQRFAERWTSGALAREFPDVVRKKRTADDDIDRLTKHVYPLIGERELETLTLDDALDVMRRLPETLAPATRRHVAQLLSRVFSLAVYPCRLLAVSPLPRGFLPKLRRGKAKVALYPDGEAALIGCTDERVPLVSRIFYGFLAREGMRSSEALALTWGDLDLERGAVRLDRNKTDDPRAWALDAGTAEALRRWRDLKPAKKPAADTPVFPGIEDRGHLARAFRGHLAAAKVTRAELFQATDVRQQVRLHDLRASFVTVSLAAGKSEAWVTARTGHRSSTQVSAYRRLADTFAEVGAGSFAPMAEAIPELRNAATDADPQPGGSNSAPAKPREKRLKARAKPPRDGFRFRRRKAWGFESLPVHFPRRHEPSC
jgi:integrase